MNCFPRVADSFEHECHSSSGSFGIAIVTLRLCPLTSHDCPIASEHRHRHITHVKFHVFDFRIRTLAVLTNLIPTLRYRTVVVKQREARRVPIDVRHRINIGVSDAVEQMIEGGNNTIGSWLFRTTHWLPRSCLWRGLRHCGLLSACLTGW